MLIKTLLIWFTNNSLYFCKKVYIFEERMCNYVQILDNAEYSQAQKL